MDHYVTGTLIKDLRTRRGITQAQLAETLCVSDKTVSKWETGKGYPDISLLQPLAEALHISLTELLTGTAIENLNVSANMLHSLFYVCPICGNIFHSMGPAQISCHGVSLPPLEAKDETPEHPITIESVEDEYYITCDHEMTKSHYISFIAALSNDRVQLVKQYPAGNASARFKRDKVKTLYYYCNRDGLFQKRLK